MSRVRLLEDNAAPVPSSVGATRPADDLPPPATTARAAKGTSPDKRSRAAQATPAAYPPRAARTSTPAAYPRVVSLLLDSGAFTAWTRGEEINIDEYIKYVKKHLHLVERVVVLDVIPGKRGHRRSQAEVEASAEASYRNLCYMVEKDIPQHMILPVFHQGERFLHLERLLKDGYDYVGISPMADLPQPTVQRWMDEVFTRLTDEDGCATVKTHGFGVAAFRLLKRYPWASCDAATWALVGGRGDIFLPRYKNGKFDYSEIPMKIKLSMALPRIDDVATEGFLDRPQATGLDLDATQFDNLGPSYQKLVVKFLEEEVGVDLARARHDDRVRYKATAKFLLEFGRSLKDVRFHYRIDAKLL